jgi:ribonuclease E
MTNPNHDTDPSTPGAKRQSDPRTPRAAPAELAPPAARTRPTTDPGVAPPVPLLPVPREPMGIVVPPVVARQLDDSIDVLLEGISRELPARPHPTVPTPPTAPTAPTAQSDGAPIASYHGGHSVPAARAAAADEPKVVIDRSSQAGSMGRVARYAGPVNDSDAKAWTETTAVTAHPLVSRVLIALVAGIAVVVVIFVALERTSNERMLMMTGAPAPASPATPAMTSHAPAGAPPSAAVVQAPAVPIAKGTAGGDPGPAPVASTAPVASAAPAAQAANGVVSAPGEAGNAGAPPPTATAADSLPTASSASAVSAASQKPGAAAARTSRPRAKPAAPTAKPAGLDLGEFKGAL